MVPTAAMERPVYEGQLLAELGGDGCCLRCVMVRCPGSASDAAVRTTRLTLRGSVTFTGYLEDDFC
jgi:hypothetical protein